MLNAKILASLILIAPFGFAHAQTIKNLELIFQEQNTAIYECSFAPAGNLVSFRTSTGNVDKHYVYDFGLKVAIPVYKQEDSYFGELVQRNTQNLLWSAVDGNRGLLKVVEEGKTFFAEIIMSKDGQVDFVPKNFKNILEHQITTARLLSWNSRGKVLLSLCGRDLPPGADIPASSYDLYSLLYKPLMVTPPTVIATHIRELHASPLKNGEFILSGVGDTGMNDLFLTDRKKEYKNISNTQNLSESWPTVSPKNDLVAFSHPHANNENTADLYIMPVSGDTPELLVSGIFIPVTSYSADGIYQWTQKGDAIVFIKYDPDQKNPITIVDVNTKKVTPIDVDIVFPSSFALSGDEKHILIVSAGTSESNEQTSYKAFIGELRY